MAEVAVNQNAHVIQYWEWLHFLAEQNNRWIAMLSYWQCHLDELRAAGVVA